MRHPLFLLPVLVAIAGWAGEAGAQTSVYYDFDNAPVHSPLPVTLTVDGVTAHLSGNPSYYNYSIQPADSLGFTPAGFSGLCIYPSSINKCDLLIAFDSTLLTDLSVLYAPQELSTDSSCTMRLTAFLGGTQVATTTHQSQYQGTWPSDTLAIHSASPFDNVVIHYDKAPPTGGDYGVIFMVDNLQVTTAIPEPAGVTIVVALLALALWVLLLKRESKGSRSRSSAFHRWLHS
jgi:hypothetical protein